MAHTLKVTVIAELDGVIVPGFPLQRRIQTNEEIGLNYQQADAVGAKSLPSSQIPVLNALILSADQNVTLGLNNNTAWQLNSGGILVLVDATLNSGATTNGLITYNPGTGVAANVNGLAMGT